MSDQLDVDAVHEKRAKLREAGPEGTVFGAGSHRYALRPCATEKEVKAFERKHKIELPEAYRTFLTQVGNGGAGPDYGIFPLGIFWDNPNPALQDGAIGDLSQPLPHKGPWNAGEEYCARQPDVDEDEDAYNEWRGEYFRMGLVDGALPICHEGCGFFFLLVVTGPERGHWWLDGRASDDGIVPVTNKQGVRKTFPEWYVDWLDASLTEVGRRKTKRRK